MSGLTGKKVKDSYQQLLVHQDGQYLTDGTGSIQDVIFGKKLTINTLTSSADLTVSGSIKLSGFQSLGEEVDFTSLIYVTGSTTILDSTQVSGSLMLSNSSTLTIKGATEITGSISSNSSLLVSGSINTRTLSVGKFVTLGTKGDISSPGNMWYDPGTCQIKVSYGNPITIGTVCLF